MLFGGRLRLLSHRGPFLVMHTFEATDAERERALDPFWAQGALGQADRHDLLDLYEMVVGNRPLYSFELSTTFLRQRVLQAVDARRLFVIPGWEGDSPASADKTPARPEAKVARQIMVREKELAFEGTSYVVLPATSWKEFSHGAGRFFEVVRREVAKATLLRMSAHATFQDRKSAFAEAAKLIADGSVAFGGLFLARRRVERTFVARDEAPALTPSQFRRLALQRLPAVENYALHVRLPVPAGAATGIADKFTLIGAKTFKSPLYNKSQVVKVDATKGEGFVDLVFEDLKPNLKYWLECRHGDLPALPFSSVLKSTPGEHERPSEATAYFVFERLGWDRIEPIAPSSGEKKGEKLPAGGASGAASGAKPRRWRLEKIDTQQKVVALENSPMVLYLTFDDGPGQSTGAVLDVLAGGSTPLAKVPSTFFLKGAALASQPAAQARIVRRMLAEGHAIGNHTYSHTRMTVPDYADPHLGEVEKDFGHDASYFRDLFAKHPDPGSPYNAFPGFRLARLPGSGKQFPHYVDMVRKHFKVHHVAWDYEYAPHGTFGHVNIDDELVKGVSAEFHGLPRDRQIVLMHDHHWGGGKLDLFAKLVAALATVATFKALLPVPSGLKAISPP